MKLLVTTFTMIFLVLGLTNAIADIDPKYTKFLLYCERLDEFGKKKTNELLDEQYHLILEFQNETSRWEPQSEKLNKDVYMVRTHYLQSFKKESRRREGYLYYYKSDKYYSIYGGLGAWFLSMDHQESEKMLLNRETLEINARQRSLTTIGGEWWTRKFECELYDKTKREQAINRMEKIAADINKKRVESIKRNKI